MLFKYTWIKLLVIEIVQSSNPVGSVDFPSQEHLVCHEYLVSGKKYNVSDKQLSASSEYNDLHAAKWGRLNTVYVQGKHIGGWAAGDKMSVHFIQVRLNEMSFIQAIATQGRNITGESAKTEQYITNYQVYLKLDDAGQWAFVRGGPGNEPKEFQGNNDSNSIHINKLPCAVEAIDVRIRVIASHNHPSMRFDVIGCPLSQVNLSPDCDFEYGFCGWKEEHGNDSINWEIKSGATSVSKPLILHDHTYKNETGLFAYLKSISSPDGSRRNRSTQLVTMIRRSNITRCLHLWHSGSDSSFGLLTLSVIGCENASERCIAKQVRDLTPEWNHISLDVSLKDYKLIVEGTVTSEDDGYLAIDDISLTKGYCPDCTFEDGFCNWKNEANSWTRIVHDSQRYIVIIGENKNTSTKAKLLGPEVDTGYKSSCLSFSYNMSGNKNNFLSVSLLLNKTITLGNLHGNDYDGWRNSCYEIVNNGEKYKIQFLASVTNGYIGLDNISLIFEPCPAAPSTLSTTLDSITTTGTWTHQDGRLTNVIPTTIAAPSISSIAPDSNTTIGTYTNQKVKSSNEGDKDTKTSGLLTGVGVSFGVLCLSALATIGIIVARRRRLRSSATNTSIQTDHKMALRFENQPGPEGNEVSIDNGQDYDNVMSDTSESVLPDPNYGNTQGVRSTHQTRLIEEDCDYAVVTEPRRKSIQETQEEQTYDHLDTGEKVPNLDDETYDHVKK